MTTRVVLADDQALVRAGFRLILESEGDIAVVAEAEDGRQAIAAVQTHAPDLILMDIQMPLLDGLSATRQILDAPGEHPTRVLILTTFERDDYIFAALRAGASGFLLKNAPPEDLIAAVRVVVAGNALLSPSVTRRIIAEFARLPDPAQQVSQDSQAAALPRLTEREVETLRLLAQGLTNAEIAAQLFVGEATVKTHVSNLLGKLNLRDRVQAVVFAYESGLVMPGRKTEDEVRR